MKFIGIDLAWTYKNETGLCILDGSGKIDYLDAQVYTDEDMVEIIKKYADEDLCIAVDAPLVLENETGAREADRLLSKAKINGNQVKLFMANRNFFIKHYKQVRGEVLAGKIKKALDDSGTRNTKFGFLAKDNQNTLIETFPTGIICGLFPEIYPVKYKVKGKVPYADSNAALHKILKRICQIERDENKVNGLIEHFDFEDKKNIREKVTRKTHKHIEDKMDAFLSAYGLYSIYKGEADPLSFGEIHDGFITIPVKKHKTSEPVPQNRNVDVVFESGGSELLPRLETLWCELNALHAKRSPNFKERFEAFTFDKRRNSIESPHKEVHIIIAKDPLKNETIGYSISSIDSKGGGEIDSIYLKKAYRGQSIGDVLMQSPLDWFKSKGIKSITLGVATGNEDVYPFYAKFGFYPKVTILERKQ